MFSTVFKSFFKRRFTLYIDKIDIYFFGMLIKENTHLIENDSKLINFTQSNEENDDDYFILLIIWKKIR
jgi:hypothetical protein